MDLNLECDQLQMLIRVYVMSVMLYLWLKNEPRNFQRNAFYIIFMIIFNPVFPIKLEESWELVNGTAGLFLLLHLKPFSTLFKKLNNILIERENREQKSG